MRFIAKPAHGFARWLMAVTVSVFSVFGSEYHGAIRSGGLPVPGATVTATRNDARVVTTTDEQGRFRFADLADGVWKLEIEILGFAKRSEEVGVAPVAPSPQWELKLLSEDALISSLEPSKVPENAAGQPAKAAAHPQEPAALPPATMLPQSARQGGSPQARNGQSPAASAKPSRDARAGFQRLDVNQSADAASIGSEGVIKSEEIADLNQTAANSFIVQGSMSSALGLPQQNDWHFGPGMGMDPMIMGLGGPGLGGPGLGGPGMGGPGMSGSAADGLGAQRDGRGGPGGSGFARGPGGPGGPPPGGPGGPGGPRGFGGPGGPGGFGGRDRRGWQGRPNAMAFGNNRRDPRTSYNGNVFLGFNNSALDARTFSVTGAAFDKPSYADLRGGIMFGGPLQIPKLVSAQKHVFFMVNYQFDRSRTGSISQPVNMPTELERMGDFSRSTVQGAAVTIFDPTTGSPFPGNRIPASRINSASGALLNYYPQPNLPFAAQNYQTSLTGHSDSDNFNSRISNIRLTAKDRLDGGIGYQQRSSKAPNLFQFVDTGSGRGINANIGWSRNITMRLINNLRYTYSRNRDLSSPYFAYTENVAANLGIAGASQTPRNWGPPNLSFTNYAGLTDGNASLNRNQTSVVTESLLWVHGNHNFTFGTDLRRQQFNQFSDQNGRGTFGFNGFLTSYLVNGVAQNGTGYDLADFLLGLPATSSIRYGNPDKYFRGTGYDFFFNDDWRISTKFTLVAGLRWDYTTPMTELYNRLVNLDVAPGFTAASAVQPGATAPYSGQVTSALIHPDRNNFSPRIGFAWRPSGDRSTVVRGGYGIYYNTSVYNLIASNMAQQPPFAQTLSISSSLANPLNIQNAFLLASGGAATNTFAVDPNYRIGYAQTWTLSVQHDLPLGMFGTIGYLGTKGTRLDQQFIPNSVPPGLQPSLLPHSFIYETSNGDSIYHAAQFQLNRRFRSGFMANTSYQFSKSIDNAGTGGRGQGNTPVAQNWLDLSAERGLSSFDSRHNLAVNFQYSTGMGRTGGTLVNGWKGALLKDWTISGNISLHSGNPFTATLGGNRSQVAGTAVANTVRANATGLPVSLDGLLFNTAAFATPAAGEWGTAGRNTIPGPTTFFLNGSVGRIFRLGERRSIDLQMQAQNVLNHVTITNWGTVLGSNNYGLATGAAAMRKVTFMLRFRF